MTSLKTYKLNFFDPTCNSNKVWIGTAYDDGTFESHYGRVHEGANLATTHKRFSSSAAALAELERKSGEKLKKGYRETLTVADGDSVTVGAKQADLKTIAADEIGAGCDTTRKLVEYLATVNIHNIVAATNIKYNAGSATFSTPLGVLTPTAILAARALLDQIANFNQSGSSYRRETAVRDYFQIVPKDFGAKIPKAADLLATANTIQTESAILDALEAAFSSNTNAATGKTFECKLIKIPSSTDDGRATFRRINELYKKSRNVNHAGTATRKMVRLYEVEIPAMSAAFAATAARLGNVRSDLWHGTRASNLLSILKNGLIIPPSSAAQVTGRMFGNGIYSSLQSTKALNYATSMWNGSGAANQKTFMFLCETALGKMHKPARTFNNLPPRGFDSTWVEPGTANVINHECVVYQTSQINLKYLAEFE